MTRTTTKRRRRQRRHVGDVTDKNDEDRSTREFKSDEDGDDDKTTKAATTARRRRDLLKRGQVDSRVQGDEGDEDYCNDGDDADDHDDGSDVEVEQRTTTARSSACRYRIVGQGRRKRSTRLTSTYNYDGDDGREDEGDDEGCTHAGVAD